MPKHYSGNTNPKDPMAIKKEAEISIRIGLDENKVPESISWSAEDGGVDHAAAKAIMLSLWDPDVRETMRIDLWTKDMPVDEMKMFFFQTLRRMADTYQRATDDTELSTKMRDFSEYFGDRISES